ncbi:MAG: two-component regulator propeller domain-containing protein [Myxococcota bacterium]|jgi:hypothetical protein|nr:hypothetical protein [Myxococcota bacterium]MBP8971094.1 hypothetical protein [Myxococcota bacterium]HHW96397.1 hypothetical protein [Oligoflexales bacterium]HQL56033.1 two-component regulator propeller domain-containing protein [Myxococcota bacterium]
MKRLLPIFLIALFVSCGGEEVIQTDTLGDTSQDSDFIDTSPSQDIDEPGEDVDVLDDADATSDEGDLDVDITDDLGDGEVIPPDHTLTFGITERSFCAPDGPWIVDTVKQFRTLEQIADLDVRAVASDSDGNVWAGTSTGLALKKGDQENFVNIEGIPGEGAISALQIVQKGSVRVARGQHTFVVDAEGAVSQNYVAEGEISKLFSCRGSGLITVGEQLWRLGDPLEPMDIEYEGATLAINDLVCTDLGMLLATSDGLLLISWDLNSQPSWLWNPGNVAFVAANSSIIAAVAGENNDQVAIFYGIGFQQKVVTPKPNELPTGGITSISVSPDDAWLALGHQIGATRIPLKREINVAAKDHFFSQRWLPDNTVNDVFEGADGTLWVATPAGLSALKTVERHLIDKAEYMFGEMDAHWRLGGFATAMARYTDAWSDEKLPLRDDDNDGQWTQEAVGALCYAYATTGDERYYEAARKAITNMILLVNVPAKDFEDAGLGRGFVTRSVVRDDEGEVFTSKAERSNWHLVDFEDGHQYYWKDDTSTDEITGHLFGFSLYYDLCAKDDAEREWVGEALGAIAGYIMRRGMKVVDLDGEMTSDGEMNPENLSIAVDGIEACFDRGHPVETCISAYAGGGFLNSVEALALMLAAYHVTGNVDFWLQYDALIKVHRYDEVATFHESIFTWTESMTVNHCDHELGNLAFNTLLRYEADPVRRAHWIDQVLASWEYEEPTRNPLKTLTLAMILDEIPGMENGVKTLVNYPEDLRDWGVDASHRKDYKQGGVDRKDKPQFAAVPPHDEIAVQRWDDNPYRIVKDGTGQGRMAPHFWLLPYWGLRYYNAICPPLSWTQDHP